jgi:BASS family bile acid:Na+ symporter
MDMKPIVILTLQVSIITTVFGYGLKASIDDLLYVVRRPGLLSRSLLAVFLVMPVVTVALVRTFEFTRVVEISLLALAISPVPPLLPQREGKARGRRPYGLALMATFGVLSIVLVPLAAEILGWMFGLAVGTSPARIATIVLVMIVSPLVAGVVVRRAASGVADRIAGPVATAAAVTLVLGVLALVVMGLPAVWDLVGDGTIVAMVLFVVIGLGVGHVLGGPEPDRAAVLALSTACRHPAIAFTVASSSFPEERFGGAIILYLLINTLVAVPYVRWQKKRAAAELRGSSPT